MVFVTFGRYASDVFEIKSRHSYRYFLRFSPV